MVLSSSSSPLCRVFILIFLRQTVSLGNTVLNLLYFYTSTFQSMCAVPDMTVFWSSLTSCFPGMLLTYFLNDDEIVSVAPIVTGITFVFTFHMRCISIVRSLYFRILSASFLITFLSPEIAMSINIHVSFSLSQIIMSGLLLGIVLSVCTCWFHNMVTLPPWLVSTNFGTCSYQCFLSSFIPVSLHTLKCSCAHTLSCLFIIIIINYIGPAFLWLHMKAHLVFLYMCLCWISLPSSTYSAFFCVIFSAVHKMINIPFISKAFWFYW